MKKLILNLFAVAQNSRPVLNKGKLNIVVMVLMVFSSQMITSFAVAKEKIYHVPKVEKHYIKSRFIDQEYVIFVKVPASLEDGSERFPVLYQTDVNVQLDSTYTELLQTGAVIPRFITVGIGYPVDHFLGSFNLRMRDLTASPDDFSSILPGALAGVLDVKTEKKMGAAPEFLQFIREELMPFINERYNTIPEETAFRGHSLGGLFGLYALFNSPDTFGKYLLASPSIWWDDNSGLRYAREYIESKKPLNARVYISVGALEQNANSNMLGNVLVLEKMLTDASVPGLELETEVFPKEGHAEMMTISTSRGLKYLYGPGCLVAGSSYEFCDQPPRR